jgi:uncharacterized protein YjbI with pentapeptide repeats
VGRKKCSFKQESLPGDCPWWKRVWGWTEFGKMTGRNWLQPTLLLLVVPLALVVNGLVFSMHQDPRQLAIEEQRNQQAQELEEQRAESERQPEEQRTQDAVLQSYLDQMSYLMLERDLRASDEGSEVRTLARARTLTVLEKLDPSRKTLVIGYLLGTNLVRRVGKREPVLSLSGAKLGDTDLRDTDLSGANLADANLSDTALSNATLSDADLSGAQLGDADLGGADLSETDLSGADLTYANLEDATLSDADLSGATVLGTGLNAADLGDADLSGAILEDANLADANLRNANLNDAYLYDANLRNANLGGALGLSKWSLAEASSLADATMPDGMKHP